MKKSNAGIWMGIEVLFLAAVYSVILFLVKPYFNVAAWVLYSATMIAFLLVGIQVIAFVRKGSGVIMDTALGIVTAIYFVLQLIFGGIVCMSFNGIPLTAVIVGELIVLAAYLTVAFLMYAAQSNSAAQDYNDRKTVQKMLLLEHDILSMMEETTNLEVKTALKDLAEAFHFSDTVLLSDFAEVEGRIAQNVAILRTELVDENADPLARIETLHQLLKERDRVAAILKR